MSYKINIQVLRDLLKNLNYSELPNVLDIETDDLGADDIDMGYTLIPRMIIGDTVTNNSLVGAISYKLDVTYKAENSAEYDVVWEKFQALYRAIHSISKSIEFNEVVKREGSQFLYIGKLEFEYGSARC